MKFRRELGSRPTLLLVIGIAMIGFALGYVIHDGLANDFQEIVRDAELPAVLIMLGYICLSHARNCLQGELHPRGRTAAQVTGPDLRRALALGEMEPFYQPIVDLESGQVRAFEALARWVRPSGEVACPMEFIRIAEQTGIIRELTYRLFWKSCATAADWPEDIILSFNISPLLLKDAELAARVIEIANATGMDLRRLELEITETEVIEDEITARGILQELGELGVRITLDDFGTGYSNLARLSSFSFDKIKMDRSFMFNPATRDKLVKAVIDLGLRLGLPTTAEGIETQDQLDRLRRMGCAYGQGYLFGKAVPAHQVACLLSKPSLLAHA